MFVSRWLTNKGHMETFTVRSITQREDKSYRRMYWRCFFFFFKISADASPVSLFCTYLSRNSWNRGRPSVVSSVWRQPAVKPAKSVFSHRIFIRIRLTFFYHTKDVVVYTSKPVLMRFANFGGINHDIHWLANCSMELEITNYLA